MAQRQHKWVKIGPAETVVLSSLIHREQPAIHRVVDSLYRTGADVFHMPSDPVHASGHAAQEEPLMLSLVRPRWFIPVHGERRHLQHHASRTRSASCRSGRSSARTATSWRSARRCATSTTSRRG